MKAFCSYDGSYTGRISDIETYEKLKNDEVCWKPNLKAKIKTVNIPFELFEYLMELDREAGALKEFKNYFDSLYGQGLEIAYWHENGELELFDNFYDCAIEAMKEK